MLQICSQKHLMLADFNIRLHVYECLTSEFWATAKAKTINGEVQIQALVDGKNVIVTKTSVRRALPLKDAEVLRLLLGTNLVALWPQLLSVLPQTKISTFQRQKKQPRRKQRKDIEVPQPSGSTEPITDEVVNEEHVPTHSNDPLLSVFDKQEVEVENVVSTAEVTTANTTTTTTVDELTLAQTLIEIKAAKPKAVTTTATITTTVVTRPKARGVVVQEPSEFTTTTSQPSQLP
ncbi:hypothetical protein Tco_1400241 [Tanacetum coccineum]